MIDGCEISGDITAASGDKIVGASVTVIVHCELIVNLGISRYENMRKLVPEVDARLCDHRMDHGFVLDHSQLMADVLKDWIELNRKLSNNNSPAAPIDNSNPKTTSNEVANTPVTTTTTTTAAGDGQSTDGETVVGQ